MKHIVFSLSVAIAIVGFVSCTHVEMYIDVPSGGVLEDAVLFAGAEGAPPREVKALGDLDLTQVQLTFPFDLDAIHSTHWWLIGHRDDQVIYTSIASLDDTDIYTVEPYDIATSVDWDIPENLDTYADGGTPSADWWAQTVNNHASHVAPDGGTAPLWEFGPAGESIGTVSIRLHMPN